MILPTSSGQVLIRLATLADVDAYRQLRLEGLQNHPTAFGQDYAEALSRPQKYWEEALTINNKDKAIFFAEAEHEGRLIGMTGISRRLSNKSIHSANVWGVYVRAEWRGNHIAEELIRACLSWAKEQGVIVVKLAVESNNESAVRCYQRCGFRTYGVEPKGTFYNDTFYDGLLMAVEL